MTEKKELTTQAPSIEIRFDGNQVLIFKKNLNNVTALGIMEIARGILLKETLGPTRQLAGGNVVAAEVPFRPPRVS